MNNLQQDKREQIAREQLGDVKAEIQDQADRTINDPAINDNEWKVEDVKALPDENKMYNLPTDTQTPKPTPLGVKKQNNNKQVIQCSSRREPAPIAPIVYKTMTQREQKEDVATLAGQFSDDSVIDNKKQRGDLSHSYNYKRLPRDPISLGKERHTILNAKLRDAIEYSKLDQLKEQVSINVNDPTIARLSDLTFDKQEQLTKSKVKAFKDPVESNWQRVKRRDFVFTQKRLRNASALIASGKMSKQFKKYTTHDNVELVRKANATNQYVDNLFNTSFGGKIQAPDKKQTITQTIDREGKELILGANRKFKN